MFFTVMALCIPVFFCVSESPHLRKNNHIEILIKNCLAIYNWYTKGLNCIINLSNNLCTQLGSTVRALYIHVIKGLNWLYMGLYYFTYGVSTDIYIYCNDGCKYEVPVIYDYKWLWDHAAINGLMNEVQGGAPLVMFVGLQSQ